MENSRSTFKGSIGFVLAAAGSAVGLGNIWRFPTLATQNGGGLFVLVYLVLAVTFGFALLTAEIAIGRKTQLGPLSAYSQLKRGWKPLGILSCIVPIIILPYYCAIGGWVLKYFMVYFSGFGAQAAEDGFFKEFITSQWDPIFMFIVFFAAVLFIIFNGVNKGIEKSSRVIMPALIILIIIISVYSLTLRHVITPEQIIKNVDGTETVIHEEVRTGMQGLGRYLIPNFEGLTVSKFFSIVVAAMGQLFYSLSIAMGIMVAYGSYLSPKSNMVKSINHIEIFDTAVAILAGVMIIPAVFTFTGEEGMSAAGPGLMFINLPKVFAEMGPFGNVVGALFFAMVFFAALTSAVSVMEAIVSSFIDEFKIDRNKAATIEGVIALIAGIIVCLGYNKLYFEAPLPNGEKGQILDYMDYISNNVIMPIVAILTCILVGWVIKTKTITDEIKRNNEVFGREWLFKLMIKYIAPVLLLVLFVKSIGLYDYVEKKLKSPEPVTAVEQNVEVETTEEPVLTETTSN